MPNFPPIDHFDTGVPMLEDGKPANVAYLNQPHQALANRTHNLNETIKASGLTRQGATRIRQVADETALKTLQGMADGEYAAVVSLGGAMFRYSATAADPELARWVVKPVVGSGRWINAAYKLIGGPGGLTTTKNQLVQLVQAEYPPGAPDVQEVSTESFSDTLLNVQIASLEIGDIVDLTTSFAANQDSPKPGGEAQIVRRDGDGDEVLFPFIAYPEGGDSTWNTLARRVRVKKAGTHTFMLQAKTAAAATPYRLYLGMSGMHATVYRP